MFLIGVRQNNYFVQDVNPISFESPSNTSRKILLPPLSSFPALFGPIAAFLVNLNPVWCKILGIIVADILQEGGGVFPQLISDKTSFRIGRGRGGTQLAEKFCKEVFERPY